MRRENHRIYLSFPVAGRHHTDFTNARHLSRQYVHQHRGRICCLASRHINAHAVQRRHLLSQQRSLFRGGKPAVFFLLLMIGKDICPCLSYHIDQSFVHLAVSFLHFFFCYLHTGSVQLRSVKLFGVGKNRRIFLFADCGDDLIDRRLIRSILGWAAFQHIFQNIFCCFFCQIYNPHRSSSSHADQLFSVSAFFSAWIR